MQWVVDAHAVSPSSVLAGDVKAIAAGFAHSMVLTIDDNVWVTGRSQNGQLGDETNTKKNKFVQVTGTWDTAMGNTLSTCTTLFVVVNS